MLVVQFSLYYRDLFCSYMYKSPYPHINHRIIQLTSYKGTTIANTTSCTIFDCHPTKVLGMGKPLGFYNHWCPQP